MAGHSKWANIKHRKAAQDAKKGQTYAKICREIIMASKTGGADPEANFRLRAAVDKAKTFGVPKDTIEQAIQKGQGAGASDNLESLTYEGYGPGGVAILIEATTDNRNRTAGDIRSYFNKCQGNLGETGCVGWMFEEKAVVKVPQSVVDEDKLLEILLDADIEDITTEASDDTESADMHVVTAAPSALGTMMTLLDAADITVAESELTRNVQTTVEVTDAALIKPLLKLLDALESHDDVNEVYANAELDASVLEALNV